MESKSPLKAKPLRNPGQSLDEQIQSIISDKLWGYLMFPAIFWLIAGLEWLAQEQGMRRMPGTYALVAVFLSAWSAVQFLRLRRQLRGLRQGRDGERAVGQFLERLREGGAHVFHDVPGDGFNLDHVVICAQGIFVIETKTYSKPTSEAKVTFLNGELLVAGRAPDRDPIRQVRAEATWLKQTLHESTGKAFQVRGVVLFPGWFVDPVPKDIKKDVWVLEPKALPQWIETEQPTLESEVVRLAAYHLARYVRSVTD